MEHKQLRKKENKDCHDSHSKNVPSVVVVVAIKVVPENEKAYMQQSKNVK